MTDTCIGPRARRAATVTFTRDYTEMAAGSVLVEFGRTRVLCTASVEDRIPPWLQGLGQGLGDRRVLDAAGLVARAGRPRGGEGQADRAARRRSSGSSAARCAPSPTSSRCAECRSPSTATCCRPTAARAPRRSAAAGSRCTTRARRLARSASCIARHPVLRSVRGDLGRRRRRHADARPRVLRGRARRGRHERRDDRRRPLRRGAGHRRRASRSPATSSTRCSSSPSRASPRSSRPSSEMVAEPPDAPRADDVARSVPLVLATRQPRQGARDRRDPRRRARRAARRWSR